MEVWRVVVHAKIGVAHRKPHKHVCKWRHAHFRGESHVTLCRVHQLFARKIGAHLHVEMIALDAEKITLGRIIDAERAVHHAHPLGNRLPLLVLEHPVDYERFCQLGNVLELVL